MLPSLLAQALNATTKISTFCALIALAMFSVSTSTWRSRAPGCSLQDVYSGRPAR